MRPAARALAPCAYAALLSAVAPRWPDDWDGVGFLEAIGDFDLAHFRPHPPGYPVYVGLLRAAAVVARDPMRACAWVGAASGALTIAFASLAARAGRLRPTWMVAALVGATPAVWHACSGVGSEAPALACLAACVWGLVAAGEPGLAPTLALGLGGGLGLGVRLSWAPMFVVALAMASRGRRARIWGLAGLACAAWATPLFAVVGAGKLIALCAAHLEGHAGRWGGTIATDPGSIRAAWLARDLFVDGLGVGGDPLGIAIGIAAAAVGATSLARWHRARWRFGRSAAILVGPYLLWIGLGQNLRDQPRHALPLVALLAAAMALAAGRSRASFACAGALAVLMAARSAADSYARATVPPPGQQLVDLARAQPSAKRLAVFGAASVRFFELSDVPSMGHSAGSLGEVTLELTRLAELPGRVWVTDEVGGVRDARPALRPVADLCRPPRLDRRSPCLGVYEWQRPVL